MGVRSIECTRDEEGDEQYQKRLLSQRLHDAIPVECPGSHRQGVQSVQFIAMAIRPMHAPHGASADTFRMLVGLRGKVKRAS